jgi:hypothetical protein
MEIRDGHPQKFMLSQAYSQQILVFSPQTACPQIKKFLQARKADSQSSSNLLFICEQEQNHFK